MSSFTSTASFALWWCGLEHAFGESPFVRAECDAVVRAAKNADTYFAMTAKKQARSQAEASGDGGSGGGGGGGGGEGDATSGEAADAVAAAGAFRAITEAWVSKFGPRAYEFEEAKDSGDASMSSSSSSSSGGGRSEE